MEEATSHYLLVIGGVLFVVLNVAAGLIWLERRMLALWQDRYGPNRAGPFGLFIVLPLLGHASWHMYRELLPDDDAPDA